MHRTSNGTPSRLLAFFAVLAFPVFLAAQPSVTLSPTSLSFGNQNVGTSSAAQVITVTNTGTATLDFTGIKLTGNQRLNFSQTNTCTATLLAGRSCTVSVTFKPTVIGSLTATLSISDNATGSPQTASLSGSGVGAAATLSVTSLSFKGVTVGKKSAAKPITITNSGTASLTVNSVVASGDFTQTNNCITTLAAGSSCTINVTFAPTAVWSRGGSIVISDTAFENPTQVVLLVGIASSGATATVTPTSLSWGNQNLGTTSSGKTITLTNPGTAALNINSILPSGDFSQTNNCPASLAVNASCTITVTFTPSAVGSRTGFLTVNDTDPTFLQTMNLSGSGTVVSSAIVVVPAQATVTPLQTMQFSAAINGISSSNVTWAVNGITGGNSTVGTISTTGLYTPPTTSATHVIMATNNANTQQTAVAFLAATNYAGTFTSKNDNLRTGQNLNEVALTTGNVNQFQFGKLFSYAVDGYVFAQPLYVPAVNVLGFGVHNMVYVATEGDTVYAFDADNDADNGGGPLWSTNFTNPTSGVTTVPQKDVETGNDIPVQIGITATPVIDPVLNTLFVIARTKEVSGTVTNYVQRLHALDITTGEEKSGSPVEISATVNGVGSGSVGGKVSFDGLRENARPALLLANGTVYIAWASLEDITPYHGWLMGYNETTLQQVTVINTTPNGNDGGVWQGGGGIAADATGNVFITTGNGTFDASVGGEDYGMAAIKYSAVDGALSVADYFAPYNQAVLTGLDWDLSSGGEMLLPDQAGTYPHVMLAAGKGSTVFVLNRDSMGGFNATADQNLLSVPAVIGQAAEGSGNRAGGPAYWQNQVFYAGSSSDPMQFSLQGSLISTVPIAQSDKHYGYPGGSPTVSANGNTNGIVWILQTDKYASSGNAILRAFDASNISRELYDSSQNSTRDKPDAAVKFTIPTVANGKVYIGTETHLDVYGLQP